MKHRRIVVLGGSGFVGRHLVSVLAAQGREVVVATRARDRAKTAFMLPRVEICEADVRDAREIGAIARGADAVVNLVGILHPRRGASFTDIHVGVTEAAIRACRSGGIRRLLHMSALNASTEGPSAYLRSKGEAEARVAASELSWTIFQPSVIFGAEDRFVNTFASMSRILPVLPLASPDARFQPVHVGDVVRAFALALDDDSTLGQRYPLCGPRVYTLREIVRYAGACIGHSPVIVPLPAPLAKMQAWAFEHLPGKLLTRDNLASMRVDSVCNCPYPAVFGGRARAMESVVPEYLSPAAQADPFSDYRRRHR